MIDFHTHAAFKIMYPEFFVNGICSEFAQKMFTADYQKSQLQIVKNVFLGTINDDLCDKLIEEMDEAGIDVSVLLILDLFYGSVPDLIEDVFHQHSLVLKKYKDRFVVFAGIDPRRGDSGLKLLERSVTELGFRGLKLYPPCGFELYEDCLLPFYDYCNARKLPVVIHYGPSLNGMYVERKFPESIVKVSREFGNINFILAHSGAYGDEYLCDLASEMNNLYLEISGFQKRLNEKEMLSATLRRLFSNVPDKMIFGTDWPLFRLAGKQKNWVEVFEEKAGREFNSFLRQFNMNAERILYR